MFARIRSSRGTSVLAELLMLVVGINIALWFEGKFDDLQDAKVEQEYLQGLHDDLSGDLQLLEGTVQRNTGKVERLADAMQRLPELANASQDLQAGTIFMPPSYDFFQPSDFTYRSMQESGDFRLLQDPELKKGLLSLARRFRQVETLQQNFIQALDDSYIPVMMGSFDIAEMRLTDPTLFDNQMFRNFFAFALQDTSNRVDSYEAAKLEIAALLEVVERQIK